MNLNPSSIHSIARVKQFSTLFHSGLSKKYGEWKEIKVLIRNSRVAKSDIDSTEVYFATKKISTKTKMAQELPKITQNSPKMTQELAPAERK